MSYIVNIVGNDPFIARSIPAIKRGLHDLFDGRIINTYVNESKTNVRIIYEDNNGQELSIVADKSKVYG